MKVPSLLRELVRISSVPGNEGEMRDFLIGEFSPYGEITKTRWTGFYCSLSQEASLPDVVVTAHMDSPGFIVKNILETGEILLISLGGLDPKKMDLRQVRIQTSTGKSFIGVLHLSGKPDGPYSEYRAFFGFSSAKEARKKGVEIGDRATFDSPLMELEGDTISSPHLDNRVGCYLMVEIAKKIHREKLPYNLHFVATSCEEMGGRGARIMANMIKPSVALCLDVTYDEEPVEMGKGLVLTLSDRSVLLSTDHRDHLLKISQKNKIPLQLEVYNYAGTDAEGFRDVGKGCITLPLLVATRNNHSPFEIMNLKDLDYGVKYCVALLKDLKPLLK